MKLTTKYLLALITTLLLLNLSVAEAVRPPRTSGLGSLAYIGPQELQGLQVPQGPAGATGQTGPAGAVASCTPYHWGDTGPDGGIVFYVDGSGCHGLEAQPYDVGANSENNNVGVSLDWSMAVTASAAYNNNSRGVTGTPGLNCSTTAFPSLTALPATPNCWHLPSKTELNYLYEQKSAVGGFVNSRYWSSTDYANLAWQVSFEMDFDRLEAKDGIIPGHVRSVRAF